MKTILLIEDHAPLRENTAELLALAGYAVQAAATGEAGLDLALAQPPDLTVCDILLPGLDGYDVLARFRRHPRLAAVPFLFLTAKMAPADRRRGMALGADDYLTKPFDEDDLLGAIAARLLRFGQLRPDYDLQAPGGWHDFLDDARATAQLTGLTAERRTHAVRRKHDIYREGDEATRAYFVQSGRVKTLKATAAGKELITGFFGPGEFFGYAPLLERTPHRDAAVAVDDAVLVYIPKDDFLQLLLRHQAVSERFIRLLAGRVSERETQLVAMAYNSIRRRVADVLVQLHDQAAASPAAAADPAADPAADIRLSRDDMAALVGMAPESLIRTLSEFRQNGLIELLPSAIRVLQPDKLRQAAW